ncbi:hypothetical protein QBC33DRAFT_549354 [Phialemonium atrogriseum]|uniref:Uncharacterized protein n=1 Tax=Phialemonium atrogriseum TaxID=1093897 RepID=A0AAJ0FDS9_9PEZI|nr:uncharacterized protein QBC33DRAFT_549354 [Phialemonium atrogriseum]KAK1763572.1 hypothetical protein QBC33DRAFT_549354 [Phialemonium atrogriseum]
MSSSSAYSNVGDRRVYEAGDQRNVSKADVEKHDQHHIGNLKAHQPTDSQDQRTIANRLAAAEQAPEPGDDAETAASKKDPTLPAKMHGNEPSRGAKIDAELQAEDEAALRKKADSVPGKKY